MPHLTFLGTGGGRFVSISQRRYTGGIWLSIEGQNIAIDPGPGALVRALQFKKDPRKLSAVFVSHKHLDHYSDAEILIEAMTDGAKKKKGYLVIEKNTKNYISEYHQKTTHTHAVSKNETVDINGLEVEILPTYKHQSAVGFRFKQEKGDIIYSADTGYEKDLVEKYRGARILILNVIFPWEKKIESHLNADKAKKIIQEVKPELAIIWHFGISMLNQDPEKQAGWIQKETGVHTMAATDGMELDLNKDNWKQKRIQSRLK